MNRDEILKELATTSDDELGMTLLKLATVELAESHSMSREEIAEAVLDL